FRAVGVQHTTNGTFVRETEGLDIKHSTDVVAIRASLRIQSDLGSSAEFGADIELNKSAAAVFRAEYTPIVAKRGELNTMLYVGTDLHTPEFAPRTIDDTNGKLDHVTAGDLKRQLGLDRKGLNGFDLTGAGAEGSVRGNSV